MKALLNQLGFYLFFAALAVGCLIWGIMSVSNPDASTGETSAYFITAAAAAVLAIFTYRYEKRHNLNQ